MGEGAKDSDQWQETGNNGLSSHSFGMHLIAFPAAGKNIEEKMKSCRCIKKEDDEDNSEQDSAQAEKEAEGDSDESSENDEDTDDNGESESKSSETVYITHFFVSQVAFPLSQTFQVRYNQREPLLFEWVDPLSFCQKNNLIEKRI